MFIQKFRAVSVTILTFGYIIFGMKPLQAEVNFERGILGYKVSIFGTITRADADQIAQHEMDFEYGGSSPMKVVLDSPGGDVDAAMQIGRIIRRNDGMTIVSEKSKCFSSCALIYVAGVTRIVSFGFPTGGTLGLHRPYLASAPQNRRTIEREIPLMLQQLKTYLQEMGVPDAVYQEMVNTEPSDMKLYGDKQNGLRDVHRIIPNLDPTYDEIQQSYDARGRGISTMEMRRRKSEASSRCALIANAKGWTDCQFAVEWGLNEQIFADRTVESDAKCTMSNEDRKALDSVKRKERRDHPIMLKRESCVRNIMLGR